MDETSRHSIRFHEDAIESGLLEILRIRLKWDKQWSRRHES
ncbi:hypothetical protein HDE80_003481 [Rhodanobacter sp. A1T4]|nr:hypothetical protein [Rhodanobacter sp. A1T4]